MSRFVAPDLAALGDVPQVVPVDFEEIKAGRDQYLIAALKRFGLDYNVANLETDPLVIGYSEGGGYAEMNWRQRVNEAIRGLLLATSTGRNLDHISASFYGISRLVYQNDRNDRPPNAQWDDLLGRWVETDDIFRARTALAPEAFSTAGPEGGYVFHTLELDGVRDIADAVAYSEEDGATYSSGLHSDAYSMGRRPIPFANRGDGDPVLAPENLIVVLPSLAYGPADQSLLDRVWNACLPEDVRPLGDTVRIEPAAVTVYDISVVLHYAPGADVGTLVEAARSRLAAYAQARRRIGLTVQRSVIGGRAAIDDNVTVEILSPAADIEPGPKGVGQLGTLTVTAVQGEGTWS